MIELNFRQLVAAGAVAVAGLMATSAGAVSIDIFDDMDVTTGGGAGLRGVVECDVACSVLRYVDPPGAYEFGGPGELFNGPTSSGDAKEIAWINSVLVPAFEPTLYTVADITGYTNTTDANAADDWTLTNKYVILKIGNEPDYTIIRNDSDGALTFSYTKASGAKGSLSHFFGFGAVEECDPSVEVCGPPVGEVPVPAALPLLLSALGVTAVMTRRRRKAA